MIEQKLATSAPLRRLRAEDWVLLIGLFFFGLFICVVTAAFFLLRDEQIYLPPIVKVVVVPGFTLPPVWTATPIREVIPTPLPTQVFTGTLSPHLYTPRGPRLAKHLALPSYNLTRLSKERNDNKVAVLTNIEVLDLARIMQGESGGDPQAAYQVGWVAKNRLNHGGYGETYREVSSGFFGYRESINPTAEFLEISRRVITDSKDPTNGCLYALSRTDITNLGVPARRADGAFHEWFFFRTWPLGN